MSQLTQMVMVLSFVLPYLIATIQQEQWSSAARARATFVVCLVAAVAVTWAKGLLDVAHLPPTFLALFALTITFYKGFAQANGAAAVEAVTTKLLK